MSYTLTINGKVLKIDGVTPFGNSDGLSIKIFQDDSDSPLGNTGIQDNQGNFSFTLNKPSNLNLIIKVYDEQTRLLYESNIFTPTEDTHFAGNFIVTNMPIPHVWMIRGFAFNGNADTHFTQGLIRAYDGHNPSVMLAENGFGHDGSFNLTINRMQFQNGDVNKIAPFVIIRISDYNQNILWQHEPFTLPGADYYIYPVVGGTVIPNIPEIPENWKVSGTIFENNAPSSRPLLVKVFDKLYGTPTLLGEIQSDITTGTYTIEYTKSAFQKGDSGRTAPNLMIEVYDANNDIVATSGIFYNANTNATIDAWLANTPDDVPLNWTLGGTIKKYDGTPMSPPARVNVWDIFNGREYLIGTCDLDSSGNYTVGFTKGKFRHDKDCVRKHPHLLIRVYDANDIMVGHGYPQYNDSENIQFDLTLPSTEVTNIFHVSGRVTNTLGYPVVGCVVVVKNIMLVGGTFQEVELGRAVSQNNGVYNIAFHPDIAANSAQLDRARFVVEVYRELDKTLEDSPVVFELVGRSNLITVTNNNLTFDFVVDMPSNADVSSYTDIYNQLTNSGFTDDSIIELSADESKLDYAAELTGGSKSDIFEMSLAMSILAALRYELSDYKNIPNKNIPNKIDSQVIYALVKTGAADSFGDIIKITAGRLQTILVSAITQSIVPPTMQNDLSDIVSEWREIYSILITQDIDASNAGRIFQYAMPEPNEDNAHGIYNQYYSAVVETYTETAHDLEKFWNALETRLTKEGASVELIENLINRLKFFFNIHMFADEFVPLSNAMMEYADEEEFTILEDFVILEKTDWSNGVIRKIKDFTDIKYAGDNITEWPESVPGESDADKRSNYATILYRRIIELFPMDRFRFDLSESLKDANFESADWWQNVYEFLNVKTDFDFANAITDDDFYCDTAEDGSRYILDFTEEQIQELYGKLLIVQRLYRLNQKFAVIDNLIKNDFVSAMSIAHKNCDEFAEQCAEVVGGIDDAQALHAAAVHTASQALFLMGTFNSQNDLPESSIPAVTEKHFAPAPAPAPISQHSVMLDTPIGIQATSAIKTQTTAIQAHNTSAVAEVSNNDVVRKPVVPNIATLFGSQNQKLCQECQSVFSPSAYTVDLLEFLNEDVRAELFSRRPDLFETDLSCRNTNGAVAYIDLVNEILEGAVCPRTFNISNAGTFFSNLKNKTKTNFKVDEIPAEIMNEFTTRGFYIDKDFNVQIIKDVDDKLYVVGDGMRYLISALNVAGQYAVTPYPQTGKDAQLRRAKPEHTHLGAYDVLKDSLYSANLPFNLPFAEVNEFLKLKNINRYELYNTLNKNANTETAMQAFFEMTDIQKNLLINEGGNVWELWGFSSESEMLSSLGNAESVMKKLDITFDQFIDLMHTYFVSLTGTPQTLIYLDWEADDAYENGELDKLLIKKNDENGQNTNLTSADYSRMVRLQRLSNHLNIDVITLDRLLLTHRSASTNVGENLRITAAALVDIYKCLRIADVFSVSPVRAASWLYLWIDNFNLGRGAKSLFEEMFLANVDTPNRAVIWKDMMNDALDNAKNNFNVSVNSKDRDVATLLKGLNVNYHDLSLIASNEFENNGSVDAATILVRTHLTIRNLAKMFRVADFSRVLGVSISDFYTLKSIVPHNEFTFEFLTECRTILTKLNRFKISVDEFSYLLSGNNADVISWLSNEDDADVKMIARVRTEIEKTKLRYDADSPELSLAIEETILNTFAATYKINVDTCRTIFENVLHGETSEKSLLAHWVDICAVEDEDTQFVNGYLNKIANVAFLIRMLRIGVNEFDFIVEYLPTVYNFDFNELGTSSNIATKRESLFAMLDMYILNGELPFKNRNVTIFNLLQEVMVANSATSIIQTIAREINWQLDDVTTICNSFGFNLSNLKKINSLSTLNNTCGLLRKVGLTASFASELISTADNSYAQGEVLISALRATYTQTQWIEVAEPIRNNLRRLQRDALCAYLLSTGNYVNRAAIYARFLIDVSMDTDVMTTRIVQANSSIQMFLQRALLNFENITLDDKTKQQWTWMRNYRLWEANRKIFLYPENWLEPEFRDDKTPLFKELESALQQKTLNPQSIRDVFCAYTSGLSDIANLEVIGAYSDEGQGGKVLHVVGRSFHYPHSYYYRCNHDVTGGSGYWTPWEKIDLDITADVALPVPFRNKVYIFWPIIELKEKAVENEKITNNNNNNSKYNDSFKYYELKLAWSELSDGKWSAKRLSQNEYIHPADHLDEELVKSTDVFHFKTVTKADEVEIQVFVYQEAVEEVTVKTKVVKSKNVRKLFRKKKKITIQEIEEVIREAKEEAISKIAAFSFGADNNARLISVDDERNYIESSMIPLGTAIRHNRAESVGGENQNSGVFGALAYSDDNVLLGQMPKEFTCFPVNLSFFDNTLQPFFLNVHEKTLFVKPIYFPNSVTTGDNVNDGSPDSRNAAHHHIVNFYHPLADDLVRRANLNSVDDLLNRSVQANAKDQYPLGYAAVGDEHAAHLADLYFNNLYLPDRSIVGELPVPANDFSLNSAFGIYNWELFFHLPLYIATRLSSDKQYEEAMRWFHYIFDPSLDFTTWERTQRWTWDLPDGARFWNFLPFFANRGVKDSIYKAVEKSQLPNEDTKLGTLIEDWKNDPFKPHLIARVRMAAYQKSVVMKYLDNLIEWGDTLFRLDNMESVNEATQLYTHASEILGDRPVLIPELHERPGLTYTQLKAEGLDQFSNAVIMLENYIPPAPPVKVKFWRAKNAPSRYYYYHYNYNYTYNSSVEAIPQRSVQLLRMAPALHYFCIPRNDRLIAYWDVVDDRLFKIRHSLNIDGVKRVLPLFAPPIDPGMLARATAMGISIGEIMRDMQTSPVAYRFSYVFQKAMELCNELKSFGSELLSAFEKKDAEALSLLRNNHETELLMLVKEMKKKAVEESIRNLEALQKTKSITEERYNYYKNIERTSEAEALQFVATATAAGLHTVGQTMKLASSALATIPSFTAGALVGVMGGAIVTTTTGGEKVATSTFNLGDALIQSASIFDRVASVSGLKSSYDRRWAEWKLQERLAQKELAQLDKQLLSAEIRVRIAENDLSNLDKQIEHSLYLKEVMESKFTNEKLYQWMSDELNKSYNFIYDIAYSAAKKAEKAFQFELGTNANFITPEVWDSARNGLLAGNRLALQLRQMDAAYLENNKREFEITKAVSLNMLSPEQILELRDTGTCVFELPEIIYDLDFAGHYFRRIKSVRITIPCVTGAYTSISAKLTLKSSKIRVCDALESGEYQEIEGANKISPDTRFMYEPIPPGGKSIVASSAMSDSGMFDFNFRDERYLPFEGAGAISTWSLELPDGFRQFDYNSISDVILHISYTARESSLDEKFFKDHVVRYLDDRLKNEPLIPNLINLRQSFDSQFKQIVSGGIGEISLSIDEHFPHLVADYIRRNKNAGISNIDTLRVFVFLKDKLTNGVDFDILLNEETTTEKDAKEFLCEFKFNKVEDAVWSLKLADGAANGREIENIFLYFEYSLTNGN